MWRYLHIEWFFGVFSNCSNNFCKFFSISSHIVAADFKGIRKLIKSRNQNFHIFFGITNRNDKWAVPFLCDIFRKEFVNPFVLAVLCPKFTVIDSVVITNNTWVWDVCVRNGNCLCDNRATTSNMVEP